MRWIAKIRHTSSWKLLYLGLRKFNQPFGIKEIEDYLKIYSKIKAL